MSIFQIQCYATIIFSKSPQLTPHAQLPLKARNKVSIMSSNILCSASVIAVLYKIMLYLTASWSYLTIIPYKCYTQQCGAMTLVIFICNTHEQLLTRHPKVHPLERTNRGVFWEYKVINVLPWSRAVLYAIISCYIIVDHILTASDCIYRAMFARHWTYMNSPKSTFSLTIPACKMKNL